MARASAAAAVAVLAVTTASSCTGHARSASTPVQPPPNAIAIRNGPCKGTLAALAVAGRHIQLFDGMLVQAKVGDAINVSTLSGCSSAFGLGYRDIGLLRHPSGYWIAAKPGSISVDVSYDSCTGAKNPCSGAIGSAGSFTLKISR